MQSPISTLPPEILSLVFQHACTIPDLINRRHGLLDLSLLSLPPVKRRTQFILSAVSVRWRQVSLSTPRIWTSVDLSVETSTANKVSAILRAYFTYSGNLPLAIGIQYTHFFRQGTDVLVDAPFDAVLRQNTHRIQELYLCDPPETWIDFLPFLPNLINLCMTGAYQEIRPVVIKSQCSRLTLKSLENHVRIHCSKITVLHLYDIPVDSCLEFLQKCPNLIEYKNREPLDPKREAAPPGDSFALPLLETFEWSVNTEDMFDVALLQHVRMPALRELIWVEENHAGPDIPEETDPRRVFFRNLPSTLTVLHIHDAEFVWNRSTSVFDLVPDSLDVEHLILSGSDVGFLNHVFERLTPASEVSGSQRRVGLRKLKSILIQGYFSPEGSSQDKILQMLERRFLDSVVVSREPFQLEFGFGMTWLPQYKEKLKEMVGRGLKVEIREESMLVDWL